MRYVQSALVFGTLLPPCDEILKDGMIKSYRLRHLPVIVYCLPLLIIVNELYAHPNIRTIMVSQNVMVSDYYNQNIMTLGIFRSFNNER